MTLFDSDSQYRETAGIFRLLHLLPLRMGLPEGRIVRWFAVNIPMNLLDRSSFVGDIDLMCSTRSFPQKPPTLIYKTWEIKLALSDKLGVARSLKRGKNDHILQQLRLYREFGSPSVSLLELHLCEAGMEGLNRFPSTDTKKVISQRIELLRPEGFGYQILPFAHDNEGETDVGVYALHTPNPVDSTIRLLPPEVTTLNGAFLDLVEHLEKFVETTGRLGFIIVAFCKNCRKLSVVGMKEEFNCPTCGADLDAQ